MASRGKPWVRLCNAAQKKVLWRRTFLALNNKQSRTEQNLRAHFTWQAEVQQVAQHRCSDGVSKWSDAGIVPERATSSHTVSSCSESTDPCTHPPPSEQTVVKVIASSNQTLSSSTPPKAPKLPSTGIIPHMPFPAAHHGSHALSSSHK